MSTRFRLPYTIAEGKRGILGRPETRPIFVVYGGKGLRLGTQVIPDRLGEFDTREEAEAFIRAQQESSP